MPHTSSRSERVRWGEPPGVPVSAVRPPRAEAGDGASRGDGERGPQPGLLAQTAESSAYTEFYSPIPDGYRRGFHKYIFVLGTVMSGLGKGIFASSIAKMLKDKGLVVAPVKMEGYLNIDSGTLNPYRHGEVFVLEDGTECDMDLGTYERMLDQDLSRRNFTTSGQIFTEVLERERRGAYLGRDVQWIPHITGEVKRKLRELAVYGDGKRPADVVVVEVGGTVGDYENGFYIEALRELAFEEGPGASCFVALTYIIEPRSLGEQKSKAAQLGIKRLMEAGIQPHLVGCRATNPVSEMVMQKIAMFSNVPLRRVFSMHDRESIYTIPEDLRLEGLDREILSVLTLHDRVDQAAEDRARERWMGFVRTLTAPRRHSITIGLTGKYAAVRDAYASIDKALEHCSAGLSCAINLRWIDTTEITSANVVDRVNADGELDAIIVPGGFGVRGVEGKIACVRHARESGTPYLGICLGFQVAVIEFARNVLGLADANSTEFNPRAANPVISELPDQKRIEGLGGTMRLGGQDVAVASGSLAAFLFSRRFGGTASASAPGEGRGNAGGGGESRGPLLVRERFRHRYEVDPAFIAQLEAGGMIFSGRHPAQPIMQIMELPRERAATMIGNANADRDGDEPPAPGPRVHHPYFIGGQFHPELTSRPLFPQPMFMGLVAAAIQRQAERAGGTVDDPAIARWLRPRPASTTPGAMRPRTQRV